MKRSGMAVPSTALFDKCVEVKLLKDGTVEVHCKLGLWAVSGSDREFVRANAMHYWIQYYHDGEYDEMLSNAPRHFPARSDGKMHADVGASGSPNPG